jgi:hypothetical protein
LSARISRPSGAETVIRRHGSPSRKTCSPASPSVALTSTIIVASSRRIDFDGAWVVARGLGFAAAIPKTSDRAVSRMSVALRSI